MTSVFLPLPELKAPTAPLAVSGTAASGETSGERSDTFARLLDTVLADTDTQAQTQPDLPTFTYIAATLTPAPVTHTAPEPGAEGETQILIWPPVQPAAALSSDAAISVSTPSVSTPASVTDAPAEMPLPAGQPAANLPETLAPPVTQPAQAIQTPVTGTPQAVATKPDLTTPRASVAASTDTTLQAAPLPVAASTHKPDQTPSAQPPTVQSMAQPGIASDAPALSVNAPSPVVATPAPQTPQASVTAAPPVQSQPLASAAPVVPAVAAQANAPDNAPIEGRAIPDTQAQSGNAWVTPSDAPEPQAPSPDAPRPQSATVQADALPVSNRASVTAPAPSMASQGNDLTDAAPDRAPVTPAPASAAAPEIVPAAVQAALTPVTRPRTPLASAPLTLPIDAADDTSDGETPAPAATCAEAQAPADTKPPHSPLGSARPEPTPQATVALKAEPATDAASVAIAKPDTAASEATPAQSPTPLPATPPAAELSAPRAPLQPALMTATAPLPAQPLAPQGSHLSSHAVENIAALSAQITRKLAGKTTQFDMQLKPADQGRVDVRLEINADGKLSAHLSFDSPISESEFRGRQDELRRQLEQAGFQLEDSSLSFSSRERQSRDAQHTPVPVNDTDIDIPAPLPVHNRPYAGAPVDGLYSSGQHLSLSMLV